MVKENYYLEVVIPMQVNLKIINSMGKEYIDGIMENIMKVNSQMDK